MKLPPQHGVPGRYAAALYMAAVKTDSLGKVESELSNVAALMSESKDFAAFVADPSVPRTTKIDGLNSILSKMGATDITKNFVGAWDRRVGSWVAHGWWGASWGVRGSRGWRPELASMGWPRCGHAVLPLNVAACTSARLCAAATPPQLQAFCRTTTG